MTATKIRSKLQEKRLLPGQNGRRGIESEPRSRAVFGTPLY